MSTSRTLRFGYRLHDLLANFSPVQIASVFGLNDDADASESNLQLQRQIVSIWTWHVSHGPHATTCRLSIDAHGEAFIMLSLLQFLLI